MALVIDSTDQAYITLVTTALNTLLGILGALDYTQQSYRTGVVAAWGVVSAVYVGFARKNEFPAAVEPMLQWFDYWVEGCFAGLVLAWLLLYAVNFRLLYLSVRAALVVPSLPASVRRAIETSLIAASIPAPLFISVILFLWLSYASYLRHSGWERLCAYVKPLLASHAGTVSAVLDRLLGNSVSAAFLPYLGCLLFALLCLLAAQCRSVAMAAGSLRRASTSWASLPSWCSRRKAGA